MTQDQPDSKKHTRPKRLSTSYRETESFLQAVRADFDQKGVRNMESVERTHGGFWSNSIRILT